jgi:hypothetical protein
MHERKMLTRLGEDHLGTLDCAKWRWKSRSHESVEVCGIEQGRFVLGTYSLTQAGFAAMNDCG